MGTSNFRPAVGIFLGWGAVTFSIAFIVAVFRGNVVVSFFMLAIALVFIGILVADFIWRIRHSDE